jgi:hypothetical protein
VRPSFCAFLLAAALGLSAVSANAVAAPLPADFFGVSAPDLMPRSPDDRVGELADQRAAGVRLLRQLFDWSLIEPSAGSYDWAPYDSFVASAARADMKILPVVLWTPTWASSCSGAAKPQRCPPTDYSEFGNFVATLIGRYGPSGSFWDDNPSVPRRPIVAWQLWNEPALPAYWSGLPSAQEYVGMLAASVPIIRAADPSAEIVGAGIPDSRLPGAIPMSTYVSAMYAAGVKGLIDDMAIHIYDDNPAAAVGLVEQTRATMNASGDSGSGLWISEWGWASAGKPNRFVTDLAGQAANTDSLMAQLVARHTELGVRALTEYFWHDGSDQSNVTDTWANHLGLVELDYTHKPAYAAFAGRAIDTTPPDTSISAGPSGTVAPGPQTIAFASSEPGSDFECSLDGVSFAACASPYGAPALPPGLHVLRVRAIDPYGNTDPSPAVSFWIVAAPAGGVAAARVDFGAALRRGARGLARRLARLDPRTLAGHRTARLALTWPAAGRITLSLRSGGTTLGSASLLLRHRGPGHLRLRFTPRGRSLLLGSQSVKVILTETFKPLSGSRVSARASFTLRRR